MHALLNTKKKKKKQVPDKRETRRGFLRTRHGIAILFLCLWTEDNCHTYVRALWHHSCLLLISSLLLRRMALKGGKHHMGDGWEQFGITGKGNVWFHRAAYHIAKEKISRDLKVAELRVCPGNRNHSLGRETETSHRWGFPKSLKRALNVSLEIELRLLAFTQDSIIRNKAVIQIILTWQGSQMGRFWEWYPILLLDWIQFLKHQNCKFSIEAGKAIDQHFLLYLMTTRQDKCQLHLSENFCLGLTQQNKHQTDWAIQAPEKAFSRWCRVLWNKYETHFQADFSLLGKNNN